MSNIYGDLIRLVREEKKMSDGECAIVCALPLEEYRKMEDGSIVLKRAELVLLTNALGISPSALEEGLIVYKKDLPDLEVLVEKLEEKLSELEKGIAEIREVINETLSQEMPELNVRDRLVSEPAVDKPAEKARDTEGEYQEERSEELWLMK